MSTYYLFRKKDKFILPLGETSFKSFYCEDGFIILETMIENNDISLNEYVVKNDSSKEEISIASFLEKIEKYKIYLDK